jgi:hypothetical protein
LRSSGRRLWNYESLFPNYPVRAGWERCIEGLNTGANRNASFEGCRTTPVDADDGQAIATTALLKKRRELDDVIERGITLSLSVIDLHTIKECGHLVVGIIHGERDRHGFLPLELGNLRQQKE